MNNKKKGRPQELDEPVRIKLVVEKRHKDFLNGEGNQSLKARKIFDRAMKLNGNESEIETSE